MAKKFTPYTIIPRGNGLSFQTNRALLENGMGNQQPVQQLPVYNQGVTEYPQDATIKMPDGSMITPEQHKKLLEILKNR